MASFGQQIATILQHMNIVDQVSVTSRRQAPIVLVDEETVTESELWLSGCERCVDHALIPFVYVLDALIEGEATTEYVLYRVPKCPRCSGEIFESTFVETV